MVKYQTDYQKESAKRKEHYREVRKNWTSRMDAILDRQIEEKNKALGVEKLSWFCRHGLHNNVMSKEMIFE